MKFSLITAVLNNRDFVEASIQSVLSQTHADIEHIIIDGGSTDGTLDVISRLSPRSTRLISEPDNGIYDALNKGISMATGEVIGFLHSDDMYAHDSVIEKVGNVMAKMNSESCYGDLLYVDRHNTDITIRCWRAGEFSPALLGKGWMPPHPAFFVRREVYEKFGVFDTSFRIAADYELMLRFLGRHKITTCYIPEVLVRMRTGGTSNNSLSSIMTKSGEDLRAMKMHSIGSITTLIRKNLSKLPQFFRDA